MATSRCQQKPFTNQLDIMMRKILPFLMRQEAAKPFLNPVDFIAYGLPDYPKIIKNPMDLNTIKARLNRKFYSTFINCLQDFNIMLENCYIYNSPDDPIVSMAIKLSQHLYSKLSIMPPKESRIVKTPKHRIVPSKNPSTVRRQHFKKEKKANLTGAVDARKSIDKDVECNAGIGNRIPSSNQNMCDSDLEKCAILLNELMSPKYKAINHLFLKPVDTKSQRLTDYHESVKYPIDLSTIKSYFDANLYENRTSFVNDIYLMLNNCLLYNGVDTDIGAVCRRFQADFENLYLSIFKEKCRENINDEAFYILMKIKRKHKEIEEMIRLNTEKISVARQRIDLIVNMFENNKSQLREEKKRNMLIKFPHIYASQKTKRKSEKKLKTTLKKNSFKQKSDIC